MVVEHTQHAIMLAAAEILAEGGEERLSIREVCVRAGVTAPTVYHHFGDKDGLVSRVLTESFAAFDRAVYEVKKPADSVEALARACDGYIAFGVANPTHYRLMFRRNTPTPVPAAMASYQRLWDLLSAVEADGRLSYPLQQAAEAVWSGMHGFTSLCVAGYLDPSSPALAILRDALISQITRKQSKTKKTSKTSKATRSKT